MAATDRLSTDFPRHLTRALPGSCARIAPVDASAISELRSAEKPAIARARTNRAAEFASGRSLARRCAGRLGFPDISLPAGQHREPLWPAGLTGSISHSGAQVLAWLARQENGLTSVGVDIEFRAELPLDTWAVTLNPGELDQAKEGNDYLLYFSIKESLFKALYPVVLRYIDFGEVSLSRRGDDDWKLEMQPSLADEVNGYRIVVGCRNLGDWIGSWAIARSAA